ncbi:MAG: hypothetical protein ISP90_05765 [Nevskia sp.]|nr:hypothetical protein [Nevskia sp.]
MNGEHGSSAKQKDEAAPVPGLAGLRKPRAPSQDLWPGIEARIRARRARVWPARLAALGAMAAGVLLTLGISLERGGWQPVPAPQPLASARPAPGPLQGAPHDPALLPAVAHLHPETRALVKANLKIVDSAETQLRRALNADPDAEYLKSLLASTRQQKQELHLVLADAR